MLTFRTAGESHGPAVLALVEGFPSGYLFPEEAMNAVLRRRQAGPGRSARQHIEQDKVEVLAGLRSGVTIGSPLVLCVRNRDTTIDSQPPLTRPRPGHADLAGALKYGLTDARGVAERASARETAARVAAGALCRAFLADLGIGVEGVVVETGDIEAARAEGDTVGGLIEVRVRGCPPGLGSCMQWDTRLDARLAAAVMSIQAVKGVEIGLGFRVAALRGSKVHDHIVPAPSGLARSSNNVGGIEGGMTNGEPVVVRAAVKPIPTMARPLPSMDLVTGSAAKAAVERADVCAAPAAAVVAEAMVAFVILQALIDKTGGDTVGEVRRGLAAIRRV